MKVYVKKIDKKSMISYILTTIMAWSLSIGIFIYFITRDELSYEVLASSWGAILLAIMALVLGILFLCGLLAKPRGYKAKLISKEIEESSQNKIANEFKTMSIEYVFFFRIDCWRNSSLFGYRVDIISTICSYIYKWVYSHVVSIC